MDLSGNEKGSNTLRPLSVVVTVNAIVAISVVGSVAAATGQPIKKVARNATTPGLSSSAPGSNCNHTHS